MLSIELSIRYLQHCKQNVDLVFMLLLHFHILVFFFFSSRRRHTRCLSDWSSDVCSSDLFRWLGLAAVVAVVAQGVLGGLRVVLLEDTLAIVHGSLAQAFFGLLSAIAFLTSRAAERPLRDPGPSLRALTLTAAVVVYLQIVLGALVTHAGLLALPWAGALAVFAVEIGRAHV